MHHGQCTMDSAAWTRHHGQCGGYSCQNQLVLGDQVHLLNLSLFAKASSSRLVRSSTTKPFSPYQAIWVLLEENHVGLGGWYVLRILNPNTYPPLCSFHHSNSPTDIQCRCLCYVIHRLIKRYNIPITFSQVISQNIFHIGGYSMIYHILQFVWSQSHFLCNLATWKHWLEKTDNIFTRVIT